MNPSTLPIHIKDWMNFSKIKPNVFVSRFDERHIGNPLIRSLHGGIVGTMIELVAEIGVEENYTTDKNVDFEITSSNINYMRVTKDADLFAKYEIARIGRRVAFVNVWCWQDAQDLYVAGGNCVVRILEK